MSKEINKTTHVERGGITATRHPKPKEKPLETHADGLKRTTQEVKRGITATRHPQPKEKPFETQTGALDTTKTTDCSTETPEDPVNNLSAERNESKETENPKTPKNQVETKINQERDRQNKAQGDRLREWISQDRKSNTEPEKATKEKEKKEKDEEKDETQEEQDRNPKEKRNKKHVSNKETNLRRQKQHTSDRKEVTHKEKEVTHKGKVTHTDSSSTNSGKKPLRQSTITPGDVKVDKVKLIKLTQKPPPRKRANPKLSQAQQTNSIVKYFNVSTGGARGAVLKASNNLINDLTLTRHQGPGQDEPQQTKEDQE